MKRTGNRRVNRSGRNPAGGVINFHHSVTNCQQENPTRKAVAAENRFGQAGNSLGSDEFHGFHSLRCRMLPTLLALIFAAPPAELPVAPPPRPAGLGLLPGADPSLADWTPRPALGHFEPWERATDKDWIDARLRVMDTGPFFDCTMRFPHGKAQHTVYKATVVKLGSKGDAGAVFDRNTLRLTAAWTGGFLNHSDRRFGLINTPTPAGDMAFSTPAGPGWADPDGKWDAKVARFTAPLPKEWAQYRGLYVHGERVVFSYTVGGREVLETAKPAVTAKGRAAIVRTVQVGPGKNAIEWAGDTPGTPPTVFRPHDAPLASTRNYGGATDLADSPSALTKGGPKRWGEPLVTKLERGNADGPFAVDTLTIPYKNRFNALFFCTGLDFLPDGRVAVCTCHGDVWLVTVDEKAGTCSWQRLRHRAVPPAGAEGRGREGGRPRTRATHPPPRPEQRRRGRLLRVRQQRLAHRRRRTLLRHLPRNRPAGELLLLQDRRHRHAHRRLSDEGEQGRLEVGSLQHRVPAPDRAGDVADAASSPGRTRRATGCPRRGSTSTRRAGSTATCGHTTAPLRRTRTTPRCAGCRAKWTTPPAGRCGFPRRRWARSRAPPLHFSYGRCKAFVLLRQDCGNGVVQGGVAPLGVSVPVRRLPRPVRPRRPPVRVRAERLADRGASGRLPPTRPRDGQAVRPAHGRWR